jgi:putative oxidoreductase
VRGRCVAAFLFFKNISMLRNIFATRNDWTGFILRLTLGIVLFPHGAQKLLGWFGGYGFNGTMQFFTTTAGLSWIIAFLVILIESIGALLLVIGLGTRIVALGMLALMTGIVLTSHLQNGFFMNWYGTAAGEGFEYHLLCIGLAIAIMVNGAGRLAFDNIISKRLQTGSNYNKKGIGELRQRIA